MLSVFISLEANTASCWLIATRRYTKPSLRIALTRIASSSLLDSQPLRHSLKRYSYSSLPFFPLASYFHLVSYIFPMLIPKMSAFICTKGKTFAPAKQIFRFLFQEFHRLVDASVRPTPLLLLLPLLLPLLLLPLLLPLLLILLPLLLPFLLLLLLPFLLPLLLLLPLVIDPFAFYQLLEQLSSRSLDCYPRLWISRRAVPHASELRGADDHVP
jgi:hypothetical protein